MEASFITDLTPGCSWLLEAIGRPLTALSELLLGVALEVKFFEEDEVFADFVGGRAGLFAILDCLRRAGLFNKPSVARVLAWVDFRPERLKMHSIKSFFLINGL